MPKSLIEILIIGKRGLPGLALALAIVVLAGCGSAAGGDATATVAPEIAATPAAESPPMAQVAPLFALPNAAGETVSLASYAGRSNVVLVFYRGFW